MVQQRPCIEPEQREDVNGDHTGPILCHAAKNPLPAFTATAHVRAAVVWPPEIAGDAGFLVLRLGKLGIFARAHRRLPRQQHVIINRVATATVSRDEWNERKQWLQECRSWVANE